MKIIKSFRIFLLVAGFALSYSLATPLFAQQQSEAGDPPARVARLSYIGGNVSLQATGATDWSQASLNYTVTTGDRLYTDQGGRAELQAGAVTVRMSASTDLTVADLTDQVVQLGLEQGTIRVHVYNMPSGNSVEVDTPNGALTLLGSGDYRMDTDQNGTTVSVNQGSVQVSGGGTDQTIQAGQAARLTGTGPIQISSVSLPRPDDFDRWAMDRDHRQQQSVSARYVSRDLPGYDDLDENGRWDDNSEYGPVWYPTAVQAGWVPYRFGHWVWVEPWGWTWVEDEPWGFAPFHYGRWAFIGSRWGWVPGPIAVTPFYAPALVAFVGGPGFSVGVSFGGGVGVAAWFPLGPREPFLPWYHHGDGYLRQVNVTNIRNVTNITNITNVTNVNNINYVNRTTATTAVPTKVFSSGQPVARQVVKVDPQQIAKAQVIPHPQVNPTAQAATGGGKAVPAPPVRAARLTATTPTAAAKLPPATPGQAANRSSAPVAGQPAGRPPLISKNPPPSNTSPREAAPPTPATRTAPPQNSASQPEPRSEPAVKTPPENNASRPTPQERPSEPATSGPPRTLPPNLITRRPPPPRDVPYQAHQPAMQQHPGRPLEPQQEENIRQGRPAGPMRDRELPSHAAPAPRQREEPPARPAERSREDSKKNSR